MELGEISEIFNKRLPTCTSKFTLRAYQHLKEDDLETLSLADLVDCVECYKYLRTAMPAAEVVQLIKMKYSLE